MKRHNRLLRNIAVGIGLSLLVAQDPFVLDSAGTGSITQSIANSIQVSDINNDGVNDIILSGYDSTRFGVFLDVMLGSSDGSLSQGYQTNFNTYPDTIAEYLGGIGGVDLADVNRDGWMDLYLTGSALSKLYLNSSGSFNVSSNLQSMSLTYSD